MPGWLHIIFAMVAACAAGAVWGGIAGLLRATTGANEVISTIMLNWVAVWLGLFLFGLGGPLQSSTDTSVPISNDVVENARLPVVWGDPQLQGVHIGIFIALAMLLVFWVILNRTRTGFEVRAVGFNPEAARSAGISVGRNYVLVMAICGLFAGLAGSLNVLGWQFRVATNTIQVSDIGFLGIAVALLGRNTAIGTMFAALLWGALVTGTSVRNLDPEVFEPALATNLTLIIQGLVVLLVSADILVIYLWRLRGRLRRRPPATPDEAVRVTA
jgi:general nucleoside transport system permease protein